MKPASVSAEAPRDVLPPSADPHQSQETPATRKDEETETSPTSACGETTLLSTVTPERLPTLTTSKAEPTSTSPSHGSESPTRTSSRQAPSNTESKESNKHACRVHCPTLEELQATTFSSYVRTKVLRSVTVYNDDDHVPERAYYKKDTDETVSLDEESRSSGSDSDSEESTDEEPVVETYAYYHQHQVEWTEGIARVRLPQGFCREADSIASDRTARGPEWQAGSHLGDLVLPSPMEQRVTGMAGVYEYTFFDRKPCTVAEFRQHADEYQRQQLRGSFQYQKKTGTGKDKATNGDSSGEPTVEEELTDEQCQALEQLFWKRLGPTMPPAWYGADMEGSLFAPDDEACGWSVRNLDSCLRVLSNLPGVTTSYLYAGMWASVFCAHTEDMNLLSINYLHAGAPKLWYAVAPGKDAARLEALLQSYFPQQYRACPEFLRHKRCLISPKILQKAGIPYQTTIQRPGDAVITFPGGYHWGFNAGFNMAEATNFAVAEWLPYGRKAKVCLCRHDSVRIDMRHVTLLLQKFQKDKESEPSLSWAEWSRRREGAENETTTATEQEAAPASSSTSPQQRKRAKRKLSEQERKHEFWIEVMKPAAAKSSKKKASRGRTSKDDGDTSKRKRQKSRKVLETEEQAKEVERIKRKKLKQQEKRANEIWHLAKPIGRNKLELDTQVLCIVPATRMGSIDSSDDDSDSDDVLTQEHCYRGYVVEREVDGHVRVRLEGRPRSEDLWLPCHDDSGQLFLDGGKWSPEEEEEYGSMIGKKLYWDVCDSKERSAD